MQNVELRELSSLTSKYRAHLIKAQYLTAAEVLLTPAQVLAQRTKLSQFEVNHLLRELSDAVLQQDKTRDQTVAELVERQEELGGGRITLGDPGLDELFGGGVRVGQLTEIAGQSASGKTHLCLQLSLMVQLPPSQGGLSGGALFISSEGTLPSTRLLSLASHLTSSLPLPPPPAGVADPLSSPSQLSPPRSKWDFLDNVYTEKAPDVETLDAVLSYHAPAAIERINGFAVSHTVDPHLVSLSAGDEMPASQFLASHRSAPPRPPLPIRLVILDSIAAPLRPAHEAASAGFYERSKDLAATGDRLKRLAHVYDCAVVVVNQVQDVFERAGSLPLHLISSSPAERPPSPLREHAQSQQPSHMPSPSPLSMPPPAPRSRSHPQSPTTLSRFSSTSTTSASSSGLGQPLPPPHIQYSFPSLLYNRFQSPHSSGASVSHGRVAAALGPTWTNIVNTRLLTLLSPGGERGAGRTRREAVVVFGPGTARARVQYELREDGVRSVGEVRYRPSSSSGPAPRADEEGELDDGRMDVEMGRRPLGAEEGDDEMRMWSEDWEKVATQLDAQLPY
ncbi:hypothetical protein JCM1841_002083 [Sporobolomyces salmonicolor]